MTRETDILAYRSAIEGTGRHMQVQRRGQTQTVGEEWELNYCPVTSAALDDGWLIFETDGRLQMWHARRMPQTEPVTPTPSSVRQKHPAVAVNNNNDRLVVWGEADGYFPGGALEFTVISADGTRPDVDVIGETGTIPEYSVAATAALQVRRLPESSTGTRRRIRLQSDRDRQWRVSGFVRNGVECPHGNRTRRQKIQARPRAQRRCRMESIFHRGPHRCPGINSQGIPCSPLWH
ncbi:MAG: hypothetical protein U5O39_01745 [Gammaproteobacteria bacterium]|nr:hypothetical protein [Gammaproteobacteria bacterium]